MTAHAHEPEPPRPDTDPDVPLGVARDQLAELVNLSAYNSQVTYLTRRGKRVAAIIPMYMADFLARHEDETDARLVAEAYAEKEASGEQSITLEELSRELDL